MIYISSSSQKISMIHHHHHHHLKAELAGGGSGTWNPLNATASAENWANPSPAAIDSNPNNNNNNTHNINLLHHLHDHAIDCSNNYTFQGNTSGGSKLGDWNEAGAAALIRIRSHATNADLDLPPPVPASSTPYYGRLSEDSNGDCDDGTVQEEAFGSVYKHGQRCCCSVDASEGHGHHHHRHVFNSVQRITGGAAIHDTTSAVRPGLRWMRCHEAAVSESSSRSEAGLMTYDVDVGGVYDEEEGVVVVSQQQQQQQEKQGLNNATPLMNADIRRYAEMSIAAAAAAMAEGEAVVLSSTGYSGRRQQQQLELQDLLSLYRRRRRTSGNNNNTLLFPAGSSAGSGENSSSRNGGGWGAAAEVVGLKLGGRTYFEAAAELYEEAVDGRRLMKRSRRPLEHPVATTTTATTYVHAMLPPPPPPPPLCQVDGCPHDLTTAKHYHRRHKVCEYHSKSSTVYISHQKQRFCQQCSRFHALAEFDDGKRSCRRRLADHNRRRRKHLMTTTTSGGSGSIDEEEAAGGGEKKGSVASGIETDGATGGEVGRCRGEHDDDTS